MGASASIDTTNNDIDLKTFDFTTEQRRPLDLSDLTTPEAVSAELCRMRKVISRLNGDNIVILDPEEIYSPVPPKGRKLPQDPQVEKPPPSPRAEISEKPSVTESDSSYEETNVVPSPSKKASRRNKTGKGTTRTGRKGSILSNNMRVQMALVMVDGAGTYGGEGEGEGEAAEMTTVVEVKTPTTTPTQSPKPTSRVMTPTGSSRTLTGKPLAA
ncbi:hypothetical protein ScalyP_jg9803 [Parmales sp. scaly parma]|nr:hypothetical protein ScalyP_jg9803 [Parmales sp. scaly parma]